MQRKIDMDLSDVDTPYGTLLKTWQVAKAAAEEPDYQIEYVCPMALLHHLCSLSKSLSCLLRDACRFEVRLVIYFDDITPGNIEATGSGAELHGGVLGSARFPCPLSLLRGRMVPTGLHTQGRVQEDPRWSESPLLPLPTSFLPVYRL